MDLAQYMQEHRYVSLLELIDQLPAASRYSEAFMNDEEIAEMMLDLEEETDETPQPVAPRMSEYNRTNQLISELIDQIKLLRVQGQALAGQKPKKESPTPRPESAMDRVRARRDEDFAVGIAIQFGFDESDLR